MKKHFLLLASLRFVKLSLTVAVLLLYARAFGIGIQMDSWVFASGFAASVGLLLWGPVNEVVRSRFVRQVEEAGEENARSSATSLLVFTATASMLVCIFLFVSAPQIVDTLYAANENSVKSVVLTLFVLMLPSIVIGQFLSLGTAYMNCCDVIYTPELIGIAAAVLNLACVAALSPSMGIQSLVLGYYIGAATSLVVVVRFLHARGFLRRPGGLAVIVRDSRHAIVFAAPLFFSFGAGQLNVLLEKYLASVMGVGVMSSVNYASQIKSTLQAVLTSVLFSLIVARLTQAASQQGGDVFKRMLAEAQRLAMIFVLTVLPFVFGTADALAAVLFGNASTSASALQEMALLIRLYVVALMPVALYLVYGVALLAQQKGRSYAALGVAAQLLSAAISVTLFPVLGSAVFPIALLISHWVAALWMLQRVDVARRRALVVDATVFAVAMAAAAVVVLVAHRMLASVVDPGPRSLGLIALANGFAVLVMLFARNLKRLRNEKSKATANEVGRAGW